MNSCGNYTKPRGVTSRSIHVSEKKIAGLSGDTYDFLKTKQKKDIACSASSDLLKGLLMTRPLSYQRWADLMSSGSQNSYRFATIKTPRKICASDEHFSPLTLFHSEIFLRNCGVKNG